jgi:hypothetical protein
LSLTYIHPDNLHSCWEFVKEGLGRIHDRARDRWLPEDVYAMLKANAASLYLVNERDGFAILQLNKGWDGPELFVFGAYIVPGKDLMDEAFAEVKEIGRGLGAKRIKFQSKREGWKKRAAELGYEFGHVEFEIPITP